MPRKPKRPQKDIDQAVARYLKGEDAVSIARQYEVSRAAIYQWINKAKEQATQQALRSTKGAKGMARDERISDKLRIKQLEQENELLKRRLFELMTKHKDWG